MSTVYSWEKSFELLNVDRVLTIWNEMNHIWTTVILTTSTSFVQLKILLDSKTRQNYIIQNLAMQHDLLAVKAIFRDVNIIDDTVLKMFFIYVANVTMKNNLKKTHKKQSFFIKTNIVDADVILRMKWLKKMNFILNFAKKIWILRNNVLSISNRAWNESKSMMTSMIEFIVKCLNWTQWCKSLKNEKQMMYATFQKNESKKIIAVIDVIETNSSNSAVNEIVLFFVIQSTQTCSVLSTSKDYRNEIHMIMS